jgi:hypothetical protein
MKMAFLILMLCLIPVLLMAFDLNEAAKKERARRAALAASRDAHARHASHASHERQARSFKDADLEVYHRLRDSPGKPQSRRHPIIPSRDLLKERAHWQKEKVKHERELARLNAGIRRLEWRLADRKARRKPGERVREDPTERVLEDSIRSLREEIKRFIEAFHERARKAGALPGWLR